MFIVEIQKRLTLLLFIFVAVVLTYTFIDLNKEAQASGGAFSSTKHGGDTTIDGGVWCPVGPCGVHRNRGGEVGEYWDDPDAGKYVAGECAHCHEVHASFGDEEPPPNSGIDVGPNDYLLMASYGQEQFDATGDSNAKLCWYCHEQMALGFPPKFGYGFYGFYQGQANFENSGHGSNKADFVYPGKQADDGAAETTFARDDRSASDNIGGSCLNCHTPHGIDGSVAGNDYGANPSASNYTATSASLTGPIPRQLIAYEESLCLRCHDADGSGGTTPTNAKNVKDQLDGLFTGGSGHPVRDSVSYGKHTVNSDGPAAGWTATLYPKTGGTVGWLEDPAGPGLHVECLDCHNPHSAAKGPVDTTKAYSFQRSMAGTGASFNTNRNTSVSAGPVKISNANKGAWGLTWNVANTAITGITVNEIVAELDPSTHYVYDLCLKCHSSYGLGDNDSYSIQSSSAVAAGYPTSAGGTLVTHEPYTYNRTMLTDVTMEFSPGNYGYHPVFNLGQNRPGLKGDADGNGNWPNTKDVGSTGDMSCSDRFSAPIDSGLGHTFVEPWGPCSYVTCIDCHKTDDETYSGADPTFALGPHGSARPWILRTLDRGISLSYVDAGRAGSKLTSSGTFWYKTGTDDANNFYIPADAETDVIFCLNCHRSDVYGWHDATSGDTPKGLYSRQTHPDVSSDHPWIHTGADLGKQGILCMNCHGGGTAGGIHGSNWGANPWGSDTDLTSPSGIRLLNGAAWSGVKRGTTGTAGNCYVSAPSGMSTCAAHGMLMTMQDVANYDY